MRHDEFVKKVDQRAGLGDRKEADRTALAVLQTLSDRLAGGEPEDLLSQLPRELKERIEPTPEADPMTPEEFVARVARALEITPGEARKRIRAVFKVLREAVTPGEYDDILSQLGRKYRDLVA